VLENVRNRDVAVRFLDKIATFKERAERHGASAEGNPSGGNNYRGLYNITLKSLGAEVRHSPITPRRVLEAIAEANSKPRAKAAEGVLA